MVLEERLRLAEVWRAEKTTTMLLDANLWPNPDVQQLQQKLAWIKRKANKQRRKTLIEIKSLQVSTESKDALVAELQEKDCSC